jgi:hypothetical protein
MASTIELSIVNFNALCTKSEGRDKLARFFQYAARTILGLIAMKRPNAGTRLFLLQEYAGNVMKQLAGARRTHRWCKEIPVIQNIIQSVPVSISRPLAIPDLTDRVLELMQKVTLSTFLIIDHVGWLKQVKLLRGGKRAGTGTIQLGLTFFCASNLLGMLYQLKKLHDARAEKGNSKQQKCTENALKHAMLVVQTAHLSRTYETHDALVGFLGMITSGMDVLAQLPVKAKQVPAKSEKSEEATKISPDAKAMPMPRHKGL